MLLDQDGVHTTFHISVLHSDYIISNVYKVLFYHALFYILSLPGLVGWTTNDQLVKFPVHKIHLFSFINFFMRFVPLFLAGIIFIVLLLASFSLYDLSLESKWQQVSLSPKDSSHYSGWPQQCCSFDGLSSSSDF